MKKNYFVSLFILLSTSLPFHLGAQWQAFGPAGTTDNTVVDFAYFNNELYATGLFSQINGVSAKTVVKWTGTTWQQQGNFTDWGHSLVTIDTCLFLAKYRSQNDSNYLWYFNGSTWKTLGRAFKLVGGSGLTPDLYDVIKYNNSLYVCGEFNRCGTDTVNGIARWNGSKWEKCGLGLQQAIPGGPPNIYPHQLTVFNNQLLVAGNFLKAGTITCNGLAAWDGSTWSGFGAGFNKTVYAVAAFQGSLYVGGEFTKSGSTNLGRIARWDGAQWALPGFSLSTVNALTGNYCFVHTLSNIGNKLYVTGGFNRLTTPLATVAQTVGSVVEFDGQTIFALNGGTNNDVEGIIELQPPGSGEILFGGFFKAAGSPSVGCNNLAVFKRLEVGMDEAMLKKPLVYPNPGRNSLTVKAPVDILKLEVFDLFGKKVRSQQGGPVTELDISQLNAGTYILRVYSADAAFQTYTFVKED